MALTKSVAAVDTCQEIAQNTILEGATTDVSGIYEGALHIDFAITSDTTHTGTKIRVQVSCNTSGDDDWQDLYEFVSLTATSTDIDSENITNNPAAVGTTAFTVASTTGFTTLGSWRFLEDVSTFANSEWMYQTAVVTNTSITVLDGSTRQHAQNSIFWTHAANYVVPIPMWANRVRIVYDNTYDADGATVAIRARISKVTAV
jgi:hypothetical protein